MLRHPNPYRSTIPPPETVVWVKSDGEALARVSSVIESCNGRIAVSTVPDQNGFVKVTRQGSLTLEELQNEFGISSVLECDSHGTMLSRTMVMDSPAQILARGKHYVVRRDHNEAAAVPSRSGPTPVANVLSDTTNTQRNASPLMTTRPMPQRSLGYQLGDKRDRHGEVALSEQENLPNGIPRKKGVTFQSKILVKEYNIGHTIDGHSQSFTLASSEPSSHAGPRPPPHFGGAQRPVAPQGPMRGTPAAPTTGPLPPVSDDWQWTDMSEVIGTHNNEVCRIHHVVNPKRAAAVVALKSEVDAFLAPYMEVLVGEGLQ